MGGLGRGFEMIWWLWTVPLGLYPWAWARSCGCFGLRWRSLATMTRLELRFGLFAALWPPISGFTLMILGSGFRV